ncbi:MAG TPA: hypothetical protein DF427_01255 [Moraxellaceae bacterium]|nr:hypothetical protein [Moraxellaceae bacterium]
MEELIESEPQKRINGYLRALVERVDSCVGAIITTVDGHLVARAERSELPAKRLAAMGSTLMSLGNTITRELDMGKCRNVISENENGVVVFLQVSPKSVLVAACSDRGSLGMMLSAAKACIDEILLDSKLNASKPQQQ